VREERFERAARWKLLLNVDCSTADEIVPRQLKIVYYFLVARLHFCEQPLVCCKRHRTQRSRRSCKLGTLRNVKHERRRCAKYAPPERLQTHDATPCCAAYLLLDPHCEVVVLPVKPDIGPPCRLMRDRASSALPLCVTKV